jgi:hypothetical protein
VKTVAALVAALTLTGCLSSRIGTAINVRDHYEPIYLAACVNIPGKAEPPCYDKWAALQELKKSIVAAEKAKKLPGSATPQRTQLKKAVAYTKEVFGDH